MHVLTDSLIQIGSQIIHIEHRGRGEDRENLLLGKRPATTYRDHPRKRLTVESQGVCTPLPEAAGDRPRVRDGHSRPNPAESRRSMQLSRDETGVARVIDPTCPMKQMS